MTGAEAFLVHHLLLGALCAVLLFFAAVACGLGLYLALYPQARPQLQRGFAWTTAAMLIASGIVLLGENTSLGTLAAGSQILAGLMLVLQYMRLQRIWRMRTAGLGLVFLGLYWGIAAAWSPAAFLFGYGSWVEVAGGILVLFGAALLWSGDDSWFVPPVEEGERPLSPGRLRKFGGEI
ncbi:MAG: hypothetical protein ACP5QR_11750 [Rhizomicrobium sp.]